MSDRASKRPKYVEAEQFEMKIDGGFRLAVEIGIDYDRIARENEARERAAAEAEERQTKLFE